MSRLMRGVGLAFVAVAWLGLTGPVRAVFPPPVKDDGKFFTKEGLDKANKKIREIYEKYKKDVVIETLASLTPEQEKKLKEETTTKFFGRLTLDRSHELGLNGVFILFVKSPQHYQIHVDPDTAKKMFTSSDRKAVGAAIVARFKEGEFDRGLLDALGAIEVGLKVHSGSK